MRVGWVLSTCSQHSDQTPRGGRHLILTRHPPLPLPSQSLPVARDGREKLLSGTRRPEIVHCLEYPYRKPREENISVAMVTADLDDMTTHFPPRLKSWVRDERTRCMLMQGRNKRSHTDYQGWWEKEVIYLEGSIEFFGEAEAALG